jgi:putative transposase
MSAAWLLISSCVRFSRRVAAFCCISGVVPIATTQPNDLWTADFKGQFKTLDGIYCYPLTLTDAHTRYVLAVEALPSVKQKGTFPVFEALFRRCGLPRAIRTDNGVPFATQALCGLSRLSVWWIKLGIDHQRIEPGRPEQNGRHERMHRTLKAETARPPEANMTKQQERFDAFQKEFNHERPHEALGGKTPASRYGPSSREMPSKLPDPGYSPHVEVRRISSGGAFRFKKKQLFLSAALAGEDVAFEETGDGIWSITFYDVLLARFDERTRTIEAASP